MTLAGGRRGRKARRGRDVPDECSHLYNTHHVQDVMMASPPVTIVLPEFLQLANAALAMGTWVACACLCTACCTASRPLVRTRPSLSELPSVGSVGRRVPVAMQRRTHAVTGWVDVTGRFECRLVMPRTVFGAPQIPQCSTRPGEASTARPHPNGQPPCAPCMPAVCMHALGAWAGRSRLVQHAQRCWAATDSSRRFEVSDACGA